MRWRGPVIGVPAALVVAIVVWPQMHRSPGLVLETVPVGVAPAAIALDSLSARVFVANVMGNDVTMLDADTGAVLRTIPVEATPQILGVDEQGGHLIVATGDGRLRVLDVTTGATVQVVDLGPLVDVLAVVTDSSARRTLVASTDRAGGASALVVLNTVGFNRVTTVALPAAAGPIVIDAATHRGFITTITSGRIAVVDMRSARVLGWLHAGGPSTAAALDARTGHLFLVHDGAPGHVTMWNTRSLHLQARTAVGMRPQAIAIDARTARVFVVNAGSGDTQGTISILDARTGALLRTTRAGRYPSAVAVDERAGRVFVVDSDDAQVRVLDARTGNLLRVAPVAPDPQQVVVDTRTGRAFVMNDGPAPAPSEGLRRLLDSVRALVGRPAMHPFSDTGSVTVLNTSGA